MRDSLVRSMRRKRYYRRTSILKWEVVVKWWEQIQCRILKVVHISKLVMIIMVCSDRHYMCWLRIQINTLDWVYLLFCWEIQHCLYMQQSFTVSICMYMYVHCWIRESIGRFNISHTNNTEDWYSSQLL